jgi:ABC-2 type transport system ATP-binding protein
MSVATAPAIATASAISTHHLTKYYGQRRVVDNLNLTVPKGSVYGFLGRNGAGKSTTIKMLVGMVHPDSGSAQILGDDCENLKPSTRARVAYMAEGHPLYAGMTIRQIVDFTRPFYDNWNGQLLEEVLDHFQLSRKARIGKLSRGQQAQVSLALAIAPDPELLILDDPTLGLDTIVRRDFLESMIGIIQRRGRTILFSSHILGDVERVADRIGVLVDGTLRVDCPAEMFKQQIRKVLVEFGRTPPSFAGCEGLVSSRPVGTQLELILVGYRREQQVAIESLAPLAVEVVELNLEDAFIEYTRGPRRPLPHFFGGATENDPSYGDQGTA